MFDSPEERKSKGNRGAIRKLRHRGKARHTKDNAEKHSKIVISNEFKDTSLRKETIVAELELGKAILY